MGEAGENSNNSFLAHTVTGPDVKMDTDATAMTMICEATPELFTFIMVMLLKFTSFLWSFFLTYITVMGLWKR